MPVPSTKTAIVQSTLAATITADAKANLGKENITADDIALPFLVLLQGLSPQLRGSTKIKGASEGDVFNTVTQEILKPPFDVIPCAFRKAWVEWVPREKGGGFVTQHDSDEILKSCKRDNKNTDILPNGNTVIPTAYHFVLVNRQRAIIALSRTQLKYSRQWLGQIMNLSIKVGDQTINPPPFSHEYQVSVQEQSNDKGTWLIMKFGNPRLIKSAEAYAAAKQFHKDVIGGIVKMVPPPIEDVATSNADDDNLL